MSRKSAETETRILDLAERMIRESGYNGFSFREIAAEVGVKSSSVHYYFPAKTDLGVKVARRYADRFLEKLGRDQGVPADAADVLDRIRQAFAAALGEDGRMCLCGVLAAESAGLPEELAAEARAFFNRTAAWLTDSLEKTDWGQRRTRQEIEDRSLAVLAQLEGGLLLARVHNQPSLFSKIKPGLD
ncbi:TetR/AcrR family transcriptional regulator [Roseibium sediminicola]|uniref:TetR/AcrR family transcriptional regulator n=1 Tax=Roseibium sediminicola TaxID=2933272 RepID=A0ABT0GSG7_9HYPH|nr:TetR/AcrR family transcriptional regulator [Roseibium sp. CAU 1639]MCK7612378.1 TetR/AcrR family transcriptional regulator [Roseibium sp. CAU 1639]